MLKRILISIAVILTAFSMSANLLDDKFEAISQIEGVAVKNAPAEEFANAGVKSAQFVILNDKEQAGAADAIFNTISDEFQFMNVSNQSSNVVGWIVEDGDENVTILFSIAYSIGHLTSQVSNVFSFDCTVKMALLCKGPKSIIDKIQMGE